jgi:hypothetical protein
MVRWSVEAQTAWLPAMAAIQPLHGVTFALLHLANMRVLVETVPPRLAATALTLYGTVGVGAAVALLTLVSGSLYAKFRGARALGDGRVMRRCATPCSKVVEWVAVKPESVRPSPSPTYSIIWSRVFADESRAHTSP